MYITFIVDIISLNSILFHSLNCNKKIVIFQSKESKETNIIQAAESEERDKNSHFSKGLLIFSTFRKYFI